MFETRERKLFALTALLFAGAPGLVSCSGSLDASNPLGKQALLDQVNIALSKQDCSTAIGELQGVYNSIQTDNNVRMTMASAYGCSAGINLFKVAGDVANNASNFTGSGFWEFLANEFPSTSADRVAESAQLAQDALQSVIDPASVVLPANMYNLKGFNPGALSPLDRVASANSFLFFVSMAGIGAFESRYGNPYPNGKKGNNLPWSTPAAVTADGCAYASSIVNFVDSIGVLATLTTGGLATTLKALQSTFQTGIYAACDQGCNVICGIGHCANCPDALRNRSSCVTGPTANTDPSSCAVTGLVNFINLTPLVGWATGP
jgi:hypothetical protein